MPSTSDNYSYAEIVVLIEEYESLTHLRATRPWIQIRLLDVDVALRKLSRPLREAVYLCGVIGLTARTAGTLAGVPKTAMNNRYNNGLAALYILINTGGRHT